MPRLNVWRDMDPLLPAMKTEKDNQWRSALGFIRGDPKANWENILGFSARLSP